MSTWAVLCQCLRKMVKVRCQNKRGFFSNYFYGETSHLNLHIESSLVFPSSIFLLFYRLRCLTLCCSGRYEIGHELEHVSIFIYRWDVWMFHSSAGCQKPFRAFINLLIDFNLCRWRSARMCNRRFASKRYVYLL